MAIFDTINILPGQKYWNTILLCISSNDKAGLSMEANQLKPPVLMKSNINFEIYIIE